MYLCAQVFRENVVKGSRQVEKFEKPRYVMNGETDWKHISTRKGLEASLVTFGKLPFDYSLTRA